MQINELILDADICMKLGRFEKPPFLEMALPKLTKKAYIHKYVYEDEILTPKSAKGQLDKLISAGVVQVLNEDNLSPDERKVFEATKNKLRWAEQTCGQSYLGTSSFYFFVAAMLLRMPSTVMTFSPMSVPNSAFIASVTSSA